MTVGEELSHRCAVCKSQTRMMYSEAIGHQVFKIGVVYLISLFLEDSPARCVSSHDLTESLHLHGLIADVFGCLRRLLPGMHEDQHLLLILANVLEDFRVAHVIHGLELFDSFPIGDTDKFLFEWTRPERPIEVEQAFRWIYSQECGHITIVGQCGTESDDTHGFTRLLNSPNLSTDNALQYRSSIVVEQMNLIYHNQPNEVGVA